MLGARLARIGIRTRPCRKKTKVSPNEPKTPVTRTLPAIDVVFENDDPPPSQRTLQVSGDDLRALRRIAREAPATPLPESRPSLPVRAVRSARSKSPWVVGGMLLVEIIRFALEQIR